MALVRNTRNYIPNEPGGGYASNASEHDEVPYLQTHEHTHARARLGFLAPISQPRWVIFGQTQAL